MDQTDKSTKANENPPPKKTRKYKRERLKKQFTVRIDEDLSKAVITRAEGEGLHLTDAMEAGLWMWLQRKHDSELVMRGRFLWSVLPMRMQRLTMSFWAFLYEEFPSPPEEVLRKMMDDALWGFRDDPRYAQRLKKMTAGLRPADEEGHAQAES
jgi:hypothetical protein